MLSVRGLSVSYGRKIRALHDVSVEVADGEFVCLIGANGAGKSTLLKTLSGLLHPDEGEILLDAHRIDSLPAHRITTMGLVHVPEGRRIFPRLTVQENLEMGAFGRSSPPSAQEWARVFDLFPVLQDRREQAGGTLSGGEQQMLAVGRALLSRPKLLMLDEPSMGLAPQAVQKIFSVLVEIHRSGTPLLLVEQNAAEALRVADRAYVLECGRVVKAGPAKQLAQDVSLREAYLGEHR